MSDYRPRFATQLPPSFDTVEPADTLENWSNVTAPYRVAWDVFTRAVQAAQGEGPGVYDDEIVPAGTTLSAMAGTGSLAFGRPANAIGAMGRPRIPISEDALKRAFELSSQGVPVNRIAAEIGVNRITLQRRLSEHGVAGNGRGTPGMPRALPVELYEQLGRAYLNQLPVEKLVTDYGVNPRTVKNAGERLRSGVGEYSGVQRLRGKDYRSIPGGAPDEDHTMSKVNNLLQYAQASGSPYDESAYLPDLSPNDWLNDRLSKRIGNGALMEYLAGGDGYGSDGLGYAPRNRTDLLNWAYPDRFRGPARQGAPGGGSDMDMMMIYGPEDHVAYDPGGNPIPLADPRHPRNQQRNMLAPGYPQQRR